MAFAQSTIGGSIGFGTRGLHSLDELARALRRSVLRAVGVGLGLAACVALCGCNGFFVYPGGTTSTGTGTSSSGDYAYVSNSSSGSNYLNGYVLSSGMLTAATGSPYSLGYSPQAMAISQNNGFLYIASDSTLASGVGYLYGYSIGSGGQLSILNNQQALENESISSLDISPDGQWLFALDTNGLTLEEYQINSSTGILTFETTYGITGAATGVVTPALVKVAPSGDFIVLALGTGGFITYTFDTSTGVATEASLTSPGSASEGYYTAAVDSNNNIYVAGTVGLLAYTSTTAGVPTLVNSTAYATGNGPRSMVVSSGNNYVYTGNQTDGTITEDSIASGPALTALTGSPVTAPATVSALGRDNSDKYILAAGYNATSGVQLFTIGSTGVLTESGSAPTGTDVLIPTVVAVTH